MSDKTGQREWFSERVKRAKGGETHEIVFDAALRAAIEPEINKSREARDKVFSRAPPALTHALNAAGFKRLAAEKQFAFDTVAHPLQPALAHLLGCGVPLDRLHDLFSGDCGRKGARSEKLALMAPLADSARRGEFCAIFRAFVLEALLCSLSLSLSLARALSFASLFHSPRFLSLSLSVPFSIPSSLSPSLRLLTQFSLVVLQAIAPHVAEETGEDTLVFQSFPCVRVNRPGEFSIGPHTDAQYGHGPGNINFYVPLTKIWGTNSLFLESSPGAQNWHPIEVRPCTRTNIDMYAKCRICWSKMVPYEFNLIQQIEHRRSHDWRSIAARSWAVIGEERDRLEGRGLTRHTDEPARVHPRASPCRCVLT